MRSLRDLAFDWLSENPHATRREAALKFGISPSTLYRAKLVLVCPSCGRECDSQSLLKIEVLGGKPLKHYVDKKTVNANVDMAASVGGALDKTTSLAMRLPKGCVMCGKD